MFRDSNPTPAVSSSSAAASASGSAAAASGSVSDSSGEFDELNFYSFFGELISATDEFERGAAARNIADRITSALTDSSDEGNAAASLNSTRARSRRLLLSSHIPSVVRLSIESPFADVRSDFVDLLTRLGRLDSAFLNLAPPMVGPSNFIPIDKTPVVESCDSLPADATPFERSQRLFFEEMFLSSGRVSHLDRLLGWHPSFSSLFAESMQFIMEDAGPLPPVWRHYIAILGSARHRCEYLVRQQEFEFLSKGGSRDWLRGVDKAPKKLQNLLEINGLMAHSPWLLTQSHIARLVGDGESKGVGVGVGADSWSVAELVQALVILSSFQSLAGFIFGLGVLPEIDSVDLTAFQQKGNGNGNGGTTTSSSSSSAIGVGIGIQTANSPTNNYSTGSGANALSSPMAIATNNNKTNSIAITNANTATASASSRTHIHPSSLNSDVSEGDNLMRLLTTNASANTEASATPKSSKSANGFLNAADSDDSKFPNPAAAAAASASASSSSSPSPSPSDSKPAGPLADSRSTSVSNTGITDSAAIDFFQSDRGASSSSFSSSVSLDRYLYVGSASDPKSLRLLNMKYTNFDVNSKSYSIFYLNDYSWKEHGYALVNRFYQGFAQLLDSEWDHLYDLTYNTVANQSNIDTGPFRRAIWYYTHRLFGLCHSDYDYNKIPVFLSNNLKNFIKKVTCSPDQLNASDYELRGYKFGHDEKCHIVMLAIEARRQASLLYALHAVMRHMTVQQ